MDNRRFPTVALAAVLVLALLFLGGSALQRNAWNQGFLMGQVAAGQDGAVTPLIAPGYGLARGPSAFGLCFGLGLFFLLFLGVTRLVRFRAWQAAGGGAWAGPGRHWHGHHKGSWPCGPQAEAGESAEGQAAAPEAPAG